MLPGVECARRRRFHQGGSVDAGGGGWRKSCTRRSSFCLYASKLEANHTSTHSLPRSAAAARQETGSEKLGDVARQAKERLDERLKSRRHNEDGGTIKGREEENGLNLQKQSEGKKTKWSSFCWRGAAWREDECAVCLEGLEADELLLRLPCGHRFHSSCLIPWLQAHANCPYCRRNTPIVFT